MNVFFSSSTDSTRCTDCNFQNCPDRYLSALREIDTLDQIYPLPQSALFYPSIDSPIRNGNLLILHVENSDKLNALVEKKENINQYRLILIINQRTYDGSRNYHRLNPRLVLSTEHNVTVLKQVVAKMKESVESLSRYDNDGTFEAEQQTNHRVML